MWQRCRQKRVHALAQLQAGGGRVDEVRVYSAYEAALLRSPAALRAHAKALTEAEALRRERSNGQSQLTAFFQWTVRNALRRLLTGSSSCPRSTTRIGSKDAPDREGTPRHDSGD